MVPMRNESEHIQACLTALQDARAAGAELIVVDGGSSDDSRALAEPLSDVVLHSTPGRDAQQRAGARAAAGEWLWFVHADVCVPAGAWREISAARAAGAGWGRFDVQLSERGDGLGALVLLVVQWMMNQRSRLTRVCTGDQAMFVSRVALDHIGGVPQQPLMEDVEMSARLARVAPMAAVRCPVRVSARRWRRYGVLRTIVLMWWLRVAYAVGVAPDTLHRWYYGR